MRVVTIPKELSKEDDLVVIPRKEYERLLQLKNIREFEPTAKHKSALKRAERNLKKGKTGPVRALDDLATEIPNRVWLTKMEEKGGSVTLEGNAVDHEDVSAFMKALQKSKYFTNIVLKISKSSNADKNAELYEFKLTCSVNYSA